MKKKSPHNPAQSRTATPSSRPWKAPKLGPREGLKFGRLSRAAQKVHRRKMQIRRAAQAQRDRKKAAKLKLREKAPTWRLPPEPEQRPYAPTVAEAEEQPKSSPRPEPAPPPPRRAVRAEPRRGTRGPNRGGESARSWQPKGERNPTRVPVDVADFLKEEF